jgi:hypothetical protein
MSAHASSLLSAAIFEMTSSQPAAYFAGKPKLDYYQRLVLRL